MFPTITNRPTNAGPAIPAVRQAMPQFGQSKPEEPAEDFGGISRRDLMRWLGASGLSIAAGLALSVPYSNRVREPEIYSFRRDIEEHTVGSVQGLGDSELVITFRSQAQDFELFDEAGIERGEQYIAEKEAAGGTYPVPSFNLASWNALNADGTCPVTSAPPQRMLGYGGPDGELYLGYPGTLVGRIDENGVVEITYPGAEESDILTVGYHQFGDEIAKSAAAAIAALATKHPYFSTHMKEFYDV